MDTAVARHIVSAYNAFMNFPDQNVRAELPAEIRAMFRSLRMQVRRYTLLSGMLGLVIVAAITFWTTTGLDSGWFALQRLELPVGLRAALLAVILTGTLWFLFRNLVIPLWRRIHDQDLAVLIERRFPEFQDRLITAVEGVHGLPASGPLGTHMLARTISDASQMSHVTQTNDVFNHAPLRKQGWLAGILALSIAGMGAAAPQTLPRWWNAFVRCEAVYHERTTKLEVAVIQQPGDRRIPFHTPANDRVYLHPRGNDLELELTVPDGLRPTGQPWVVPQRIRVDVRRHDGTTSRTYVSPTSGRVFRYVITRLQDDVEIELLAGDYRIPQPLIIRSVAPPVLDGITLLCNYPEYTQWNQLRTTELVVTGSETSLPIGTHFHLEALSSKPLQAVRIAADDFELSGDTESSLLKLRTGGESVRGPALVSTDGTQIAADFLLMPQDLSEKSAKDPDRSQTDTVVNEPPSVLPGHVLRIRPNTSLKFTLHDRDDVMSTRPLVFRVQGIKDRPPAIDVRVDGVDSAITRRAVIPFTGSIRDDYGLHSAGFEFAVDDETQWRPRPFSSSFSNGTTEFILGRKTGRSKSGSETELFHVQPLDLTEGQTLTIALIASDECTLGRVNTTRGDPVVYRVVSDEELLSLLYAREINLRRRFEAALREAEQVQSDLAFHKIVARRIESGGSEAKPEDQIGLTTCATRSGNTLRRQTNELKSILVGFDGIIQQLINNAVPPAQLSESMRQKIVVPLQQVVETDLPRADRSVSRFRVAALSQQPCEALVTESDEEVSRAIVRLKQILEDVRDMAEFHEVLSDLRALSEVQKQIHQDTKRLKRQRLIDDL